MGKRELLLIGVFLVVGMGVYQMTAPPPKPGHEGFSFGRLLSHIRAEIQGEDAAAKVERTAQAAAGSEVTRLVLPEFRGMLTLVGEERADVTVELTGTMMGIDDNVAKARAAATQLSLESSDEEITVKIVRGRSADEIPRLRNAELRVKVPARLAVTLEYRGEADLRGVAEVKFQAARGRTNVRDVGALRGEYVNGELEVLAVGEIDLKTQRTQVRIDGVKRTLALDSTHGEVRIQRIAGATKLDLDRVECEADGINGPTTVRMEHGSLTLRGIRTPTEITADGAGLDLIMASAVPLSATTTNDELMVELPKSGVTLDAITQHGRLRMPDRGLQVQESEDEQRINTPVRGGGPTLRLRNEHADIVVRDGGMMESETREQSERPERPEPPEHPERPEPVERPEPPEPPELREPPKPPKPPAPPRGTPPHDASR
jgi:hypothetical protein